jgi:predicted lipoprotein
MSEDLYRIESSRSGASLDGVLGSLDGIQQFFHRGNALGLDDALGHLNPLLVKRLHEQFQKTSGAARDVGAPLEQAAVDKRPALENAYQETRALEVLLKVDVASALGVTLTFSSNDDD